MFFSNFDSMTKRNRVLFVLWVILLTSIAVSLFVKHIIIRQYQFENHSEIPKNNY